jgi:antitoxin FitA
MKRNISHLREILRFLDRLRLTRLKREVPFMAAITINISDKWVGTLQQLANESGVSPEELLCASVEEWLSGSRDEFAQAASFVLQKNAELYRRLA